MSLCEVLPPEVPPVDGAVGVGLELVWGVVWEGEADGVALEELVEDLDVIHLLCLRLWTQVGPAKPVGRIAATAKAKERIERRMMVSKMINKTNVLSKRRKVVKDKTRCEGRTSSVKRSTEK
jgi:hypothetical protein